MAHECIIDLRWLKERTGFRSRTWPSAWRLPRAHHCPSLYRSSPMIVAHGIGVVKRELDRFCDAMIEIRKEIAEVEERQGRQARQRLEERAPRPPPADGRLYTLYSKEKAFFPLKGYPNDKYWPPVGRVDNVFGDRNPFRPASPMANSYMGGGVVTTFLPSDGRWDCGKGHRYASSAPPSPQRKLGSSWHAIIGHSLPRRLSSKAKPVQPVLHGLIEVAMSWSPVAPWRPGPPCLAAAMKLGGGVAHVLMAARWLRPGDSLWFRSPQWRSSDSVFAAGLFGRIFPPQPTYGGGRWRLLLLGASMRFCFTRRAAPSPP